MSAPHFWSRRKCEARAKGLTDSMLFWEARQGVPNTSDTRSRHTRIDTPDLILFLGSASRAYLEIGGPDWVEEHAAFLKNCTVRVVWGFPKRERGGWAR